MRLFIAIDLPREIINEAERVQSELKKKNIFIGKLVEGENLHLTLKFLGEITEEKAEEVKKKLREIKRERFAVYLKDLGVFSSNFIRIIWIRILGKVKELQKEIDSKMEEAGFEKEKRFMSHLTIARVKDVADKKIFLHELAKIKLKNLGWEVKSFFLMKSDLKLSGAEYSVLEEFQLE